MSTKKILVVGLIILIIVSLTYSLLPRRLGGDGETTGLRLVRDSGELSLYYYRSVWVPENLVPYRDVFIEYPQLAAFYLAWPMIFVNSLEAYELSIVIGNIIALGVLILITRSLMISLGRKTWPLWLMVLPAMFYFTLYRFDIWPALAVSASLLLLYKNKGAWSLLLLAVAVLFKWYAVLLIPLYWIWLRQQQKDKPHQTLKLFGVAAVISIAVVILMVMIFGEGFFTPFQQHVLARGFEAGSLFELLGEDFFSSGANAILLLLQISLPLIVWAQNKSKKLINNFSDIIVWSALSIMIFVFFAKFYSPQWILWFVPLLILLPISRKLLAFIIIHDVMNFLTFPILYDTVGLSVPIAKIVVLSRVVLLTVIIIMIALQYRRGLLSTNGKVKV